MKNEIKNTCFVIFIPIVFIETMTKKWPVTTPGSQGVFGA
jgi:hypothetical protein